VNALHEAVIHALTFVAERSVARVAFPALGDGPGALDGEARLATIVRAAHAYAEQCFVSGRAAVVEEVVVCEPNARVLGAAKRLVSGLAKTSTPVADAGLGAAARAPGATKKRATTTATRSRRKGSAKPTLSEDEIGAARATATAYDMSHRYATGDRFIHPKFGVGRVVNVTQENAIEVVFEDRSVRKMVHARG
jgi:hypothetical protein